MSDDVLNLPEPTVVPSRFCTRCGMVFSPDWLVCAACENVKKIQSDQIKGNLPTSIRSPIALYFTLLLTTLVGIIVIRADESQSLNVEFAIEFVDAVIVCCWCFSPSRSDVIPALANPGKPRWYLLAAGCSVITYLVATAFLTGLHSIFDVPLLTYSTDFLNAGYGWGVIVLSVCIQPAIVEEIAFRAIILGGLKHHMTSAEAILVRALLFMTLHLSVVSFPHLFLLGALLGWIRVKSGIDLSRNAFAFPA